MNQMNIKLLHPWAQVPTLATEGSAGYDLCAMIENPITVTHGQLVKIPTGIAIQLPQGTAAFIMGRSGLGIKHGIVPSNGVGLIDSDYRGEIIVGLTCQQEGGYTIMPKERIAQMVITPVFTPTLVSVESLTTTCRGDGGLGSTGTV